MATRRHGLFSWCGLGMTALAASAQAPYFVNPPKTPCPPPVYIAPGELRPQPAPQPQQQPQQPVQPQQQPQQPAQPQQQPQTPAATTPSADDSPNLDLGGGLALGESTVALSAPGYIDNAVPMNRLRLRYDYSSNNPFPDRAEFFYPKCGCFAQADAGVFFDPNAKGPPRPETGVDSEEIEFMVERRIGCRASIFVEAPFRFINPEQNSNEQGISDIRFGGKFALIASERTYLTAQIRIGVPTGDGFKGLGNELVSYEPALLLAQQLGSRTFLYGEVRGWIPTDGTDFAGEIMRYGVGLGYLLVDNCDFSLQPVAELVAWDILDGRKSNNIGGPRDASEDFIVNAKLGVRAGWGEKLQLGQNRSQAYIGFGRAISNDTFYEDIFRAEYTLNY